MGTIASQITSLTIVYPTVYSDADQRKHQSSAPLAFVRGIHRGPVNSPRKWPVTRKMFPFDDVIVNNDDTYLPRFKASSIVSGIAFPRVSGMNKHNIAANRFKTPNTRLGRGAQNSVWNEYIKNCVDSHRMIKKLYLFSICQLITPLYDDFISCWWEVNIRPGPLLWRKAYESSMQME